MMQVSQAETNTSFRNNFKEVEKTIKTADGVQKRMQK